ncbi:discoidin domain-containing protein [Microbacterium sulfonylureivorans]|uniref:galactose-binding domain-containing protein n=1 Tax=Microbacterium sulfonylureivorans TaxID=2486854 RepID=UPI0013E07649|nr:discoidin domain-containing protein [Microbacterium sulfonylureivorans]
MNPHLRRVVAAVAASALVLSGILCVQSTASAAVTATLYVAPAGSGTACTQSAPCSVAAAQTKVRQIRPVETGDIVVNVSGGTYSLTQPLDFGPQDSGLDAQRRVIWQAAPGANPVLSGETAVTGWTQEGSSGVWSAPAPTGVTDTRQLYIDDIRGVRARSDYLPNLTLAEQPLRGGRFTTPTTPTSMSTWKDPTGVEMIFHATFNSNRCVVESVTTSGTLDVVDIEDPCWDYAEYVGNFQNHARVVTFIENAYELLDDPGEWYFDRAGTVKGDSMPRFYYMPRSGQAMTGGGAAIVTVPHVESILHIAGTSSSAKVKFVEFRGLTVAGSTWSLPEIQGTAGVVDDMETTRISYGGPAGAWIEQNSDYTYKGKEHVTSVEGAWFEHEFDGTGIRLIGVQHPNRGSFTYQIDNGAPVDATCSSTLLITWRPCAEITGLAPGVHTLRVTKTGDDGKMLGLDVLRAIDPPLPAGEDNSVPAYLAQQGDMIISGAKFMCDVSNQVTTPAAVRIAYAEHVTFVGNTITRAGGSALLVEKSSNNVRIEGNHIFDVSSSGIHIGGVSPEDQRPADFADRMHDITITNNYVHDVAVEFTGSVAIFGGFVDTLTISHNELADLPYSGISVGWGWGVADADSQSTYPTICMSEEELASHSAGSPPAPVDTVARNTIITDNYIHDYMRIGMDGGAVYTLGNQPGSVVERNYIARTGNFDGHQRGVYLDNGTHGYTVRDNVIHQVTTPLLLNYSGGDLASSGNVDGRNVAAQPWTSAEQAVVASAGLQSAYEHLIPRAASPNLLRGAAATATSGTAANAVDGSTQTKWQVDASATQGTLTVTLPRPTLVNRIVTLEGQYRVHSYGAISSYEIEYQNPADDTWVSLAENNYPGIVQTDVFQAVTAKALRFSFTGTAGAWLDEFEAYYDKNLAQNKSATQSTTAYLGAASRAVDGDTSGVWTEGSVTATDSTVAPWWQVDLGDQYDLSEIDVFNRAEYSDRLSDFWVCVSVQPYDHTLTPSQQAAVSGVTCQHETSQAGSPSRIRLSAPGRYVMIQLGGSSAETLSLAEVEVYGTRQSSLAADRPATQSSTAYDGVADRAVDGITSGVWTEGSVTATASTTNPWWQVDLGSQYDIAQIDLFNRSEYGSRLSDYWVCVSAQPFNHTLAPDEQAVASGVTCDHQTSQAGSPTRLHLPATGRYVMVQLGGSAAETLSLAEVEVYGELHVPPNVAQDKPATQSSTLLSAAATRAVDGDWSGVWEYGSVTATASTVRPWWEVDLQAQHVVSYIDVFNRSLYGERLSDYWVCVSAQPFNHSLTPSQQASTAGVTCDHQTTQAGAPTRISLPATGRYVMVQLGGAAAETLSLAEVEVHAVPVS